MALRLNEMSVQFNDLDITIKRNRNAFVIIAEFKTAKDNNKVTKKQVKDYNCAIIRCNNLKYNK